MNLAQLSTIVHHFSYIGLDKMCWPQFHAILWWKSRGIYQHLSVQFAWWFHHLRNCVEISCNSIGYPLLKIVLSAELQMNANGFELCKIFIVKLRTSNESILTHTHCRNTFIIWQFKPDFGICRRQFFVWKLCTYRIKPFHAFHN